jgi:transcriptional regulator with XRE-family HTH domain
MTNLDYGDVGGRVAMYRKLLGVTGDELAERAGNGITRAVLANIETGRKKDLSIVHLTALSIALGVPLAALLFDIQHPLVANSIGVTRDDGEPARNYEAVAWLSGELRPRPAKSAAETAVQNASFEAIAAVSRFADRWKETERSKADLKWLQLKDAAGRLEPQERALMTWLRDTVIDNEMELRRHRDTLIDLGVDVEEWT